MFAPSLLIIKNPSMFQTIEILRQSLTKFSPSQISTVSYAQDKPNNYQWYQFDIQLTQIYSSWKRVSHQQVDNYVADHQLSKTKFKQAVGILGSKIMPQLLEDDLGESNSLFEQPTANGFYVPEFSRWSLNLIFRGLPDYPESTKLFIQVLENNRPVNNLPNTIFVRNKYAVREFPISKDLILAEIDNLIKHIHFLDMFD